MASLLATARNMAVEAAQAAHTDVTGAVQSPVALLNATAASALATLYLAAVMDDIRSRGVRAQRAAVQAGEYGRPDGPTDELGFSIPAGVLDELIGAASMAVVSLEKTHPARVRLEAALANAGSIGMAVTGGKPA